MKTSKRKTRSDKFPLTLHRTGQYCKKIKGKIHYFGSDKQQALQRYLDQATYLHGRQSSTQIAAKGNMALKDLCDLYLKYQYSRVIAGSLTPKHYNDQISSLGKLMSFLDQGRRIESISALDLQNYKRRLQKTNCSAHRLNLHLSIMKAMFHWARKNDIAATIPNIDAISRSKVIHQKRFTFTSQQIKKLVLFARLPQHSRVIFNLF
jgi:hypothetical protein